MAQFFIPTATPQYVVNDFVLNDVRYNLDWLTKATTDQLVEMGAIAAPAYDPAIHRLIQTNDPQAPFAVEALPAPDMAALKKNAEALIDAHAGEARARYITSVPGQETTYREKEDEARAFIAGNAGPFPFLEQEATYTNATVADVPNLVVATADAWRPLAAAIEGMRRGYKVQITGAADAAAIDAIVDAPRTAFLAV